MDVSEVEQGMTVRELQVAAWLRGMAPNTVVYSDDAWAAARRSSNQDDDAWFPDRASHVEMLLTSDRLAAWATDWEWMIQAGQAPMDAGFPVTATTEKA